VQQGVTQGMFGSVFVLKVTILIFLFQNSDKIRTSPQHARYFDFAGKIAPVKNP
jgi:hypothetical protein